MESRSDGSGGTRVNLGVEEGKEGIIDLLKGVC